jgi:hypothetical protein
MRNELQARVEKMTSPSPSKEALSRVPKSIVGYSALAGFVIGALGAGLTCLLSSSAFTSAMSFLGLAALHPVLAIAVVASAMALVFAAFSYLNSKGMEYVNRPALSS